MRLEAAAPCCEDGVCCTEVGVGGAAGGGWRDEGDCSLGVVVNGRAEGAGEV